MNSSGFPSNFQEFLLPHQVISALATLKLSKMTPFQARTIPVALNNRDLVTSPPEGLERLAAFCVPLVTRLIRQQRKKGLVLVPTKKVAEEVNKLLNKMTLGLPELRPVLLTEGAAFGAQVKALTGNSRILIATPCRLVDHLKRGSVSLFNAEVLVLDGADQMIDRGAGPQVLEILRFLPKTRQTMLFSGTMHSEIRRLASKCLKDPVQIDDSH